LIGFLLALGMVSYRQLTGDLIPNVDFPIAVVTTALKGASVGSDWSRTRLLIQAVGWGRGVAAGLPALIKGRSRA